MNALPNRSHAVRLTELQDACRAIASPSPASSARMIELQAYRDAIGAVRDAVDANPIVDAALAWRWRQIAGIASTMDHELRKTIIAMGGGAE